MRGSIPAWAGKPDMWEWTPVEDEVYPRVGGETFLDYQIERVLKVYPRVGGETESEAVTGVLV